MQGERPVTGRPVRCAARPSLPDGMATASPTATGWRKRWPDPDADLEATAMAPMRMPAPDPSTLPATARSVGRSSPPDGSGGDPILLPRDADLQQMLVDLQAAGGFPNATRPVGR